MKHFYLACVLAVVMNIGHAQQFTEIGPGESGNVYSSIPGKSSSAVLNNKLYLTLYAPPYTAGSVGLWSTDGTVDGTQFVFPFTTDVQSDPVRVCAHNGMLYISGRDLVAAEDETDMYGVELWISDGTNAGTQLLKDLLPGTSHGFPSQFTSLGDILFFTARDTDGLWMLWKSDGTAEGTLQVADVQVKHLIAGSDGYVYFNGTDETNGSELWRSNGSTTELVADLNPGAASSNPEFLIEYAGRIYFSAQPLATRKFYTSNGTSAGTAVVNEIYPGGNANPRHFTLFNDMIFFDAEDGEHGRELWRSDGTVDGTVLVKDIYPGPFHGMNNVSGFYGAEASSQFLFVANDGISGRELWSTNGTEAGTVQTADIYPGAEHSGIVQMVAMGDKVYFAASNDANGFRLYEADASSALLIAPVGATDPYPLQSTIEAVAFDNGLLFIASFGEFQRLWRYGEDVVINVEEKNTSLFSIYPNPASDFVCVENYKTEAVVLELISADGSLIRSNSLAYGPNLIKIDDLHPGIYLLRVFSKKEVVISTLVKY